MLSNYEKASQLSWRAMKKSHDLIEGQYSRKQSISYPGKVLDYTFGSLRNLLLSSIEFSDLAKFNILNALIGNLPSPQTFEWETT